MPKKNKNKNNPAKKVAEKLGFEYIDLRVKSKLIKHFLKYKSDGISAPDGKYYSY